MHGELSEQNIKKWTVSGRVREKGLDKFLSQIEKKLKTESYIRVLEETGMRDKR